MGITTLGEIRENGSRILPKLLPSVISNGQNTLAPRWYAENKHLQTWFYCNTNILLSETLLSVHNTGRSIHVREFLIRWKAEIIVKKKEATLIFFPINPEFQGYIVICN